MDARELLELAADYAQARETKTLGDAFAGDGLDERDDIARRFEEKLTEFVTEAGAGQA